jgi:hypothetical protein
MTSTACAPARDDLDRAGRIDLDRAHAMTSTA